MCNVIDIRSALGLRFGIENAADYCYVQRLLVSRWLRQKKINHMTAKKSQDAEEAGLITCLLASSHVRLRPPLTETPSVFESLRSSMRLEKTSACKPSAPGPLGPLRPSHAGVSERLLGQVVISSGMLYIRLGEEKKGLRRTTHSTGPCLVAGLSTSDAHRNGGPIVFGSMQTTTCGPQQLSCMCLDLGLPTTSP